MSNIDISGAIEHIIGAYTCLLGSGDAEIDEARRRLLVLAGELKTVAKIRALLEDTE
jgi:hypothetical protein